MNALIVASLDTTYMQSEVQELVNSLNRASYQVRLLQANVSSMEIYRSLEVRVVHLLWIAAHADSRGFVFAENVITPKELGLFMRQARVRDAVFNTCYSINHITEIQRQAAVNIVANINPELPDKEAWTSALYLGRKLSETVRLELAFRDTLADGISDYRWFPSSRAQEGPMTGDENELEELKDTVTRLETTISRLLRILQGDSFLRTKGLIENIQELERRVAAIENKSGNKLYITPTGLVIIFMFSVLVVAGLMYLTYILGGYPLAHHNPHPILTVLHVHLPDGNQLSGIS